jgi:Icc protein
MDLSIPASINVLQLTDTHLFGTDEGRLLGVDTYQSLADVIDLALLERGRPDFVLLTGDLTQDETADSYARLRKLVGRLGVKTFYLPGNHDVPELMAEILPGNGSMICRESQFEAGNWQVIMLNSHRPGRVEGLLAAPELERLERLLGQRSELNALVCLHHNPVSAGSDWQDRIALENSGEFLAVLSRFKQVRAVLWGHVHQAFDDALNGMMLMATPSTCVQFKPNEEKFGVDEIPPGYRWLELQSDGQIVTAVSRLPALPNGLQIAAKGY